MIPKGFKHSKETRLKMRLSALGKVISEAQKEKARINSTGNKNALGHKMSEEARKKASLKLKGRKAWNKGLTKDTHPSVMSYAKKQSGSNSHLWKGGIAYEPYPFEWQDDIKESIRKRDGFICKMCGVHRDEIKEKYGNLDIHHIDYNKDNLNPENLMTLCRSCHIKTNHNREYWLNYFTN